MRKNHRLMLFLVILLMISSAGQAQKLIVKMKNGNENQEQLVSIQKLYFSNNELIVDYKAGADDSYALADVRKIYFDASVSIDENNRDGSQLNIYPNPANTLISVDGIPEIRGQIRVFRMDGSLVVDRQVTSSREIIDISTLPDGLYLVNVAGFTSKFVKK